ncbi:alanine racemase [Vibrio sp. JC009]|uniref:alanine racemase n=1 Tax=Vibrio sp. JC009 TaxID=2912314 RepID=UPI0023B13714|nr:alanine racemase [Vibrio sp. JC009]WED24510.1 alanine racemase [Vibrio sp. JC009]
MVTAEAIIDLAALKQNYQTLKSISRCNQVVAVVKGDAYGHGAVEVARALNFADKFAVSRIEEAVELRDAGIKQPILLLEGCFCAEDLIVAAESGFETVIHQRQQLDDFLSSELSTPVKVWLKVDTGMHRVGVTPELVSEYVSLLSASASLDGEVNFVSHFSCADDPESPATLRQIERFSECVNGYGGEKSIANSAAILNWRDAHFDWVRAGIALYGISPDSERTGADYQLSPVMTLKSKLIAVREHKANQPVGYGEIWTSDKDTKIGVIALGYGDGYPRLAPQGTPVWINGREVPISGRVSMDMITVDLGNDSEDKPGDSVEFWGSHLPVEKVSNCIGTIPYELTIKLTKRVVKTYKLV